MAKKGLGKGLEALFADNATDLGEGMQVTLRLSEIEPNRGQPRHNFDEEALEALAQSIRDNGVLQPLVVRPIEGSERYQLVAGERRWRASRMAGLSEVPVVIKDLDDRATFEIALIENLQREDLDPVEEAKGYRALMDEFGMTQEDVAAKIGKSRPAVANSLRLLSLPEDLLDMVSEGTLSEGHGRALLACQDEERMRLLAGEAVKKGLTVRAVEKLAKPSAKKKPTASKKDVTEYEIEQSLSERFGRKVKVSRGRKGGRVEIEFYDEDDLRALSRMLAGE